MFDLINFINCTINTEKLSFFAQFFSFCSKLYFLIALLIYGWRSQTTRLLTFLLILFLTGALLNDLSWVLIFVKSFFHPIKQSKICNFIIRIGWSLFLTQYQALSLFLTCLVEKKLHFSLFNKLLLALNVIVSMCFLYLGFFKFHIPSSSEETLYFECNIIQTAYYILPFVLFPSLYSTLKIIRAGNLPKILTQQSKIFIAFLILPHLFLELIANKLSFFSFLTNFIPINEKILLSISTVLCSYAVYYYSKSVMGLRFLNFSNHVESPKKFNFINDFKDILEQLSYVTALEELSQLTKMFFKDAFGIPVGQTKLYLKQIDDKTNISNNEINQDTHSIMNKVENFLFIENNEMSPHIKSLNQTKIFIKDEIEFSNFYEVNQERNQILAFLDNINADIFLPIYERQTITAYIIVERNARKEKLYNSAERDEMLVFTSYLSNIINILKNSQFEVLIKKEKELKEELFFKHQEINQYKESLRSFLRSQNERHIGIVFYRANKFTFANKIAQELISIDINTNHGHPLTKNFRDIVRQVEEYKSSSNILTNDINGAKIILSAIPGLEQNNIFILIYHPDVSDTIKPQLDLIKDPTKWDYLLYLETTQSGKVINQLIPGNGENLLNFKIDLLTASLSSKAILLDAPDDDILSIAEVLHHISLRQKFHVLKLTAEEKHHEVAMKLFGINPLIANNEEDRPLLEKLDNIGTLFIQNIHFLNKDTQNCLARYISNGFFYKLKSEHKMFSNLKIVCSTTKNLETLVAEGKFSKILYDVLKKTSLNMPSLSTLSNHEATNLATGFAEQALKTPIYENLVNLNEKDKNKILEQKPASLLEFKEKIHQTLSAKSVKQEIENSVEFDSAYYISDPEVAKAVRLGKYALKDQKIMTMLWTKFNNQTKIANLLGVNRSSVNRRCKEYNLLQT